MTTQAETNDSIIRKTALLIDEDESAIARLVEIKDQNAATADNETYLQDLINSKKFEDISGAGFRQMLNDTFLNELYQNAKAKKTLSSPELPISADIIVPYFMDITETKSAHELIKRNPAGLQEIILNECRLLQSPDAGCGRIQRNKADEIQAQVDCSKDETVVLRLANKLYKQILFGNMDLPALSKKSAKNQEFMSSSKSFTSMKDIIARIDEIPDDLFSAHAQKKDFQNWLQGKAFPDEKKITDLAGKIGEIASKKDLLDRISAYAQGVEQKKFMKEKGKAKQNHLLAARLFLKSLRPELQVLIPKIATKEGLKCLKLVDSYILQFEQDLFRKEFVLFLRDPFAFAQQKEADYRFDFTSYFSKRIKFNIRYKSGIDNDITDLDARFAAAGIFSKADYDRCKELQDNLGSFIKEYQGINLPDMDKVTGAVSLLERRIKEADDLISEQQKTFASARKELGKKHNHLKKFLGRNPTERNISVYHESRALVESFHDLQLHIDSALVPEYASFTAKRDDLISLTCTRATEFIDKFNSQENAIRDLLSAKSWDKEQYLEELEKIRQDSGKLVDIAKRFYGNAEADVLTLLEDIDRITESYHEQKRQNVLDIHEVIAEFKLGNADLEWVNSTYLQASPDAENESIRTACSKILALEECVSDSLARLYDLRKDEGLSDAFQKLDEALAETQAKILEARKTVYETIDDKVSAINQEARQVYDNSQDVILLANIKQEAQALAGLASAISYSDKNAELRSTIEIAKTKVAYIKSRFAKGRKTVSAASTYIAEKQEYIRGMSKNIMKSDVLQLIFNEQKKLPGKIAECSDWAGEDRLKDEILKLNEKVEEIDSEIDSAVNRAIAETAEKTRKLKPFVKSPEKASIIDARNRLRNRKIQLSRISQGKYAPLTAELMREVKHLIESADAAVQNFRDGLDNDLNDIVSVLSRDFEWSSDKELILQQMPVINSLEKDAALLAYSEKKDSFAGAKSLAKSRIKEIDGIVDSRKCIIQKSIDENSKIITAFSRAKEEMPDKNIIDRINEAVEQLKLNINQYSAWKQDDAYAALFRKADNSISGFRTRLQSYVLEQISRHDAAVNNIFALASADDLSPDDAKTLKAADAVLEAQRQKYLLFDKDIFTETVAQKIKFIENAKENAAERIDSLADAFDTEIDSIGFFLSKNVFEHTQNMPILDENQKKLETIKEYCTALSDQDLLDSLFRVEDDISKRKIAIQDRFNERKKMLDIKVQALDDAVNDIACLLDGSLSDEKIAQCYLILHAEERSVDTIEDEWKKDNAVAEIYSGLDAKAKDLRKSIESVIFAKVAEIDAAAQQDISFVDAAALHTPEVVKGLLAAEARLGQSLESYSMLLRHEQGSVLSEKQAAIHEVLKISACKLDSLKGKLREDIMGLENQAKKEHHKYTQHRDELEKDICSISKIREFLQLLQEDENLGAIDSAEFKINEKVKRITQTVAKKKEELVLLHDKIIKESRSQLADLWKNMADGCNIRQAANIISSLYTEVHKHGSWRMDDDLAMLLHGIDDSLNRLQNYQIEKVNTAVKKYDDSLASIKQEVSLSPTHLPGGIRNMQEKAAEAESIKAVLEKFKAASPEYDVFAGMSLAEEILSITGRKHELARKEIKGEIGRIISVLYEKEFSQVDQLAELENIKSKLQAQKDIGILVCMDLQDIDFLTEYVAGTAKSITDSADEEKESLIYSVGRLKNYANMVFALLEQPLDRTSLKTVLGIAVSAREYAEGCGKKLYDAELGLILDAVESRIDSAVEVGLEKISNAVKNRAAGICRPESREGLKSLLSVKSMLEAKSAEYHSFMQDRYLKLAEDKISESSLHLEKIQGFESGYYAETKEIGKTIKQNRKELMHVFCKAKAAGPVAKLLAGPEKQGQMQKCLDDAAELGILAKKSAELRDSLSTNQDAAAYLARKKDALLFAGVYSYALAMQKSICSVIQQELDAQTITLMQDWYESGRQLELESLCSILRAKRAEFNQFRKSVLPETADAAKDISRSYNTLIQRAVAIKDGYETGVQKNRQQITLLKGKFIDFYEKTAKSLSLMMDNLPEGYMNELRSIDSELRVLQASAEEFESRKIHDSYSKELLESLCIQDLQYASQFAEKVGQLKNAVEQREKLKESGVLPSKLGGLRSAWKKVTNITRRLARNYQQDVSALQEIEKIRQYHKNRASEKQDLSYVHST